MDTPSIFVAFGVTGNLMRLKILPALYALHTKGELPERFAILGVSRQDWSHADLRAYVAEVLGADTLSAEAHTALHIFLHSFFFVKGDTQEAALYDRLAETFSALESTWGVEADKILYLSLSSTLYRDAFEHLRHATFAKDSKRVRLMIEKPFGTSGKSAEKLHSILANTFEERAIYRVDHYLAKDALSTIPAVDGTLVSELHFTFLETAGVEKRGHFFDMTGALLDMGQNHMLKVLARTTMKHSRAEALEALHILSPDEVSKHTVRGQYDGYRDIPGVAPDSDTDTYFMITSTIDTPRFPSVRVILEGGKSMPENKKEIRITFKDGRVITHPIGDNKSRSEYELLIHDCMRGNQTRFVSKREVGALWRFIDPIIEGWRMNVVPITHYAPGTYPLPRT